MKDSILKDLQETLSTHPNIDKIYFNKDGSYSFNAYSDGKKDYTRNGEEVENNKRKFDDKFLVAEVKTREEILNTNIEPTVELTDEEKNKKSKK